MGLNQLGLPGTAVAARLGRPVLLTSSNTINIPQNAVAMHVLGVGGGGGGITSGSASSGASSGAVGAFRLDLSKFPGMRSAAVTIGAASAAGAVGNDTTLTLGAACKITWKGGLAGAVGANVAPGSVLLTALGGTMPFMVSIFDFSFPYGWAYPLAGLFDIGNAVSFAATDLRSLLVKYGTGTATGAGNITAGPPSIYALAAFSQSNSAGGSLSSCPTYTIPAWAIQAGLSFASAGAFTATAGSGAAAFSGKGGDGINGPGTSACNATGYGNGGGSCTSGTAGTGAPGAMVVVFEFGA